MTTYVRTQEIDHEIGRGGQFALRVTSPDVEMRAVDGDRARVRATFEIRAASDAEADEVFERVRLNSTELPGSLEVTEPRDGPGGLGSLLRLLGGSGKVDTEVAVDAPRGCALRYDGVSADVTASRFRGPQQYRTVSGDLVLEDVGGDLRVKGVSSDISLRASETLPSLEINTVSGDVSAMAPSIGQLHVVTVSGDVSLGLSGGGLNVEVRGLSTDVEVRLPHRAEGSRDRRRYVIGAGGPDLLFSSMSGDIEVRTPHRGAPLPPAPPAPPAPPTPR